MKISASVYSGKKKPLTNLVKELDQYGVDYFHMDCEDDPAVFDDIKIIQEISETPIDLHIITSRPEKFYPLIEENNIDKVTFQYEHLPEGTRFPIFKNSDLGLAITSDTPIEAFAPFHDYCSFILVMTTTPGQSGGEFNKESFRKVRNIRNRFPGRQIHVDGGVNDEVSFILRNMGVDLVVSGSFLVNADSVKNALRELRHKESGSKYIIADFMVNGQETPILPYDDALSMKSLFRTIEDYDMGFAILTDEKDHLKGISTNADLRKGLLKNIDNLNEPNLDSFINTDPIFINQNKTIEDLLKLVKKLPFPLLYLPVVDNDQKVVGCLTFNNLIKGET